jgi:peptidoglycan/LPS O-acetylase OafA/YrhL
MGFIRLSLVFAVLLEHVGSRMRVTNALQAVEIFFLISGYYMALTFTSNYDHSRQGVAGFYASRVLRLFPFYYFMVLIAWLLYAMLPVGTYNQIGVFSHFTGHPGLIDRVVAWILVGQDIVSAIPGHHGYLPLRPSWSLSAELMFYLALPLLITLQLRTLIILACASLALKTAVLYAIDWPTAYFPFPCQIGFFIIGIISFRFRNELISSRKIAGAAWFLVMLSIYCPFTGFEIYPPMSMLQILAVALAIPTLQQNIQWRADRIAGDLSYGVYLSHILFADLAISNINDYLIAKIAVVSVASLGISFVFEEVVQKRIDNWRRNFFYRRRKVTAMDVTGTESSAHA